MLDCWYKDAARSPLRALLVLHHGRGPRAARGCARACTAYSLSRSLLRSPIEAHGRSVVNILFGRRARALERNSTTQYIGLEVPDERRVEGSTVGVRM